MSVVSCVFTQTAAVKDSGGYSGSGLGPAAKARMEELKGAKRASVAGTPASTAAASALTNTNTNANAAAVAAAGSTADASQPDSATALVSAALPAVNLADPGVRIGKRLIQKALRVPRVWRDGRGNLSSDTTTGTTMPADMDLVRSSTFRWRAFDLGERMCLLYSIAGCFPHCSIPGQSPGDGLLSVWSEGMGEGTFPAA
jgi:hypothetical protein